MKPVTSEFGVYNKIYTGNVTRCWNSSAIDLKKRSFLTVSLSNQSELFDI